VPEIDIEEGLALHLDPNVLVEGGATYSVDPDYRVHGDHYFVCIAADAESGNWVPLFSSAGKDRFELRSEHKRGYPGWVSGTTHFHKSQAWQIPHAAVPAAAEAGNDLSTPLKRNRVTAEGIDFIWANHDLGTPAV